MRPSKPSAPSASRHLPDAESEPDRVTSVVRGAQSVQRALDLLRRVATCSDTGIKLAQLVRDTGLDRATAYRLMSCLVEERFVDRGGDQSYRIGPDALLLGSLLPQPTPLLRRFVPAMKRIGRVAGDTVFLMMRQGDFVYCAHREEGSSPIKILTTSIGQRRQLGMGTGGTAILGFMSDAELVTTHARNAKAYAEHGIDAGRLIALGAAIREQGCAMTFDAFGEVGVAGLGIAFKMGEHGMGALSIATLTARFGFERQHTLRHLIETELDGLGLARLIDQPMRSGR